MIVVHSAPPIPIIYQPQGLLLNAFPAQVQYQIVPVVVIKMYVSNVIQILIYLYLEINVISVL